MTMDPRIKDWGELWDLLDEYSGSWLFRGTASEYGNLRPSLLRRFFEHSPSTVGNHYGISKAESACILEFATAAHLHLPRLQTPNLRTTEAAALTLNERLEWSILLQHYSAPSRLLDWSASLFVATYFAVANHWDRDGELWVTSYDELRRHAENRILWPAGVIGHDDFHSSQESLDALVSGPLATTLKRISEQYDWRLPDSVKRLEGAFPWGDFFSRVAIDEGNGQVVSLVGQLAQCDIDLLVNDISSPIVVPFSDPKPTDRILNQQGWFTFAYDASLDHHAINDVGITAARYVIPSSAKPAILSKLRMANVTAHSMFPGLDGLGWAVNEKLLHRLHRT